MGRWFQALIFVGADWVQMMEELKIYWRNCFSSVTQPSYRDSRFMACLNSIYHCTGSEFQCLEMLQIGRPWTTSSNVKGMLTARYQLHGMKRSASIFAMDIHGFVFSHIWSFSPISPCLCVDALPETNVICRPLVLWLMWSCSEQHGSDFLAVDTHPAAAEHRKKRCKHTNASELNCRNTMPSWYHCLSKLNEPDAW